MYNWSYQQHIRGISVELCYNSSLCIIWQSIVMYHSLYICISIIFNRIQYTATQTTTKYCHTQTKSHKVVWNGYEHTTYQLKHHSYTILYDGFIPNQIVSIITWIWCTWSCNLFEMKPYHHGCSDEKSSVPLGSTAAVRGIIKQECISQCFKWIMR